MSTNSSPGHEPVGSETAINYDDQVGGWLTPSATVAAESDDTAEDDAER